MTTIPKLKNYDLSVLICLGNQTTDMVNRNKIKILIIEKILQFNASMFFLLNCFRETNKILREAYAEVLTMKMKDNEYDIDDEIIEQIVSLVSLDTLIEYGAESISLNFREKCIEEFWNRALEIEDKVELGKKSSKKKNRLRRILQLKRKGDKNDKY